MRSVEKNTRWHNTDQSGGSAGREDGKMGMGSLKALGLASALAATIGAAGLASAAEEGEKIPAKWFSVERVSAEEAHGRNQDRRIEGLLSLADLQQRQEILAYTREQLMQVDPCWAEYEFEDEIVYYPGEGPTGGGQRPFVFIPGRECGDAEPDDPDNGDDHDVDPPPWADERDPEYWFTQCEEAQDPEMWNCWIVKGRPCGPDDDPNEGCLDVDPQLVYPIEEEAYLVDEECPEGSPTGVCDVLIRSYHTDIDYGPDFFEMRHEDWRNCGEHPQLCPEGSLVVIDCDLKPSLCELEVEIVEPGGLESNNATGCEVCYEMHEAAKTLTELACQEAKKDVCSSGDEECGAEVERDYCTPFSEEVFSVVGVCYSSCEGTED